MGRKESNQTKKTALGTIHVDMRVVDQWLSQYSSVIHPY